MRSLDRKWTERFFANVSWGLGNLHLALSIIYIDADAVLMFAINIACFLASSISIRLIRKELFRAYILTVYVSELIHLIVSAVCVGWSSGLQLPLLALAAYGFFAEYLSRSAEAPFIPALPLGIIDFCVAVTAFLFRFQQPGLLPVPESTVKTVQILWSVLVFAAIIIGFYSVLKMTSDSEKALTDEAQTDRLTGLYNRAGFDRLCAENDLNTTALLIIDTDKFKGINDRFGHETGDRVLRKISGELRKHFRCSDFVCRIGGDEFAVLMVDTAIPEEGSIRDKIDRINRELSRTAYDHLPAVSVSVGAAHGSEAGDWIELYKHADEVLYRIKKEGGRSCGLYRPQSI